MHQAPINDLYVLDSVQHDALAAARAERLTRALGATAKVVSREELDEAARQWPWRGAQFYPRRTGSFDYAPGWTIVLDTYAAPGRDGGVTPAGFRNAAKLAEVGGVCRSALEIHCASGCFHRCAYCHCHPDFHIACDLETMLELLPGYFAEHADQLLWKFDNGTDTLVLEPEYGASELMVPFFAAADRFLMLYTKSDNVDHLLDLPHNGQTIINWSLAGRTQSAELELGAPDSFARIKAMRRCQEAGYTVRARLSPIVPVIGWREELSELFEALFASVSPDLVTLDVLGWMDPQGAVDAIDQTLLDPAYSDMVQSLLAEDFHTRGKHMFPHGLRLPVLQHAVEESQKRSPTTPVSICGETQPMWEELGGQIGMTPANFVCCCGPHSVPGRV